MTSAFVSGRWAREAEGRLEGQVVVDDSGYDPSRKLGSQAVRRAHKRRHQDALSAGTLGCLSSSMYAGHEGVGVARLGSKLRDKADQTQLWE
jgi:hypothetical protein